MSISEKIQYLRKENNYSQEELAELCQVSRQAISKWEAGLTIPEVEKIIQLSKLFHISIDTLLKDELELDIKQENTTCHQNALTKQEGYFEGLLIKESISDENILDILKINKVELWETKEKPRYWTALYFTSLDLCLPEKLSKVMIADPKLGGPWYSDFKNNNIKYIVFKNKILTYEIGNEKAKNKVIEECEKLGIKDISNILE